MIATRNPPAEAPMNKLAIAAAALLLVALFALPVAVGAITEARVRERVAAIDSDRRAAAELRSFERGWFRSTARIDLRPLPDDLAASAAAAGNPLGAMAALPIVVEYAHGPIAVLDGVHFGWAKLVARPDAAAAGVGGLMQALGVPYLFEFRGRSGYLGGLDFDADAPPFEVPVEDALLRFSGATLRGSYAAPRLEADARIGAVEVTSETGSLAVRGVNFSTDSELRSQYVMPGQASFAVDAISVVDALRAATLFEARNLRVASQTAVDPAGELLEVRIKYDVDSVRLENGELTAGALGVAMRNLDIGAVEAYSKLAADAAAAGVDPAALAESLAPHFERALRAGLSIAVDPLRFRYDGEPFDARVEITTNAARLPAAGLLRLDNPLALLGLFDVNAELRVAKPLATRLATIAARQQLGTDPTIPPEQLDYMAEAQSGLVLATLIGQGVLVEDGEAYRSSFDYTDGAITLNGNALPFALP
jgi:uncharacterized protein YdgA (DUF945 family)